MVLRKRSDATPRSTAAGKLHKKARGGKRESIAKPAVMTTATDEEGWVQMLDELGYDDLTGASSSSNNMLPLAPMIVSPTTTNHPMLWWPSSTTDMTHSSQLPAPVLADMTGMTWNMATPLF